MTAPDVDWAEVERRGRRSNWLALPAVPLFFGAVVLLTGKYAFWEGTQAWLAVGAFVVFAVVMQVLSMVVPRFRARAGASFRIQYALRHRVDPGPELREKADRYAAQMAGNSWIAWLFPWWPIALVLTARWDAPARAVPSALVIVACVVALTVWWRRQTGAARRWVADPPGPARELAAPGRWARWMSGRRLLWLMLGVVVATAASTAVLVAVT
jgi:hypothetical protein